MKKRLDFELGNGDRVFIRQDNLRYMEVANENGEIIIRSNDTRLIVEPEVSNSIRVTHKPHAEDK